MRHFLLKYLHLRTDPIFEEERVELVRDMCQHQLAGRGTEDHIDRALRIITSSVHHIQTISITQLMCSLHLAPVRKMQTLRKFPTAKHKPFHGKSNVQRKSVENYRDLTTKTNKVPLFFLLLLILFKM